MVYIELRKYIREVATRAHYYGCGDIAFFEIEAGFVGPRTRFEARPVISYFFPPRTKNALLRVVNRIRCVR